MSGAPVEIRSRLPPVAEGPAGSRRWSRRGYGLLLIALGIALVVAVGAAISLGSVGVPLAQCWQIVAYHLFPGLDAPNDATQDQIVWAFRLPRTLLAVLVGACLGLVGTVLQAVVRNPLADPYLLGVSAGASLGAVIVIVLGSGAAAGLGLSGAAFAGALVATALVYLLAQRRGVITPARLVLSGVALAHLFQSAYSYLLLKAASGGTGAASGVFFWLLGSLAGARWEELLIPSVVLAVGGAALLTQARSLNSLLAGEESAVSLGLDVRRFRIQMLLLTSLLVGVMVAVSGAIAFVGLIVPHLVRLVVGSDHRRVLPVAALVGATFLVLVDLVARTADQPAELPLSIVTAVVGAPFFLWLLRRRGGSSEGVFG